MTTTVECVSGGGGRRILIKNNIAIDVILYWQKLMGMGGWDDAFAEA